MSTAPEPGSLRHRLLDAASTEDPATLRAEAAVELERLALLADGRFREAAQLAIEHIAPTPEGLEVSLQSAVIPMITEFLAAEFKRLGGENSLTIELEHPELGGMMLTIQRREGLQPYQQVAKLRGFVAAVRKVTDDPRHHGLTPEPLRPDWLRRLMETHNV